MPVVTRELRDLRCCDGDAVALECKVHAAPEEPLVRWERGGKVNIDINSLSSLVSFSTWEKRTIYEEYEISDMYLCGVFMDAFARK